MAQDLPPSNEDRISHLEATIDDLKSQGEATKSMLQDILDKLGAPAPNPVPSPVLPHLGLEPNTPLSPISTFNTPSAGRKRPILKASVPGDFTGDRTKGKAFLSSCRTYMRLCPEAFPDETTRIIWALSFMKSDRAYRWAQRALDFEVRVGALQFLDWADFEKEFRKDFTPLNAEAAAVNTLEGTSYFQGKRSVDDYLDQFRDLVEDSGYTDKKTLVVKFRRGLDRRIASTIGAMATGRPSDTNPEGWYSLAVQLDQNRATDEAFQASYRSPQTSVPHSSNPRAGLISVPRVPAVSQPVRFAHTNPTPGNPVPMDIDAARKAKAISDNCRRCGKPGHWSKDCELRFDVRHMTAEEMSALMENQLAALDVAHSEPEEEVVTAPVEDFVSSSE
jgi:hypothetical protein